MPSTTPKSQFGVLDRSLRMSDFDKTVKSSQDLVTKLDVIEEPDNVSEDMSSPSAPLSPMKKFVRQPSKQF